jgi:hypothetical protein
MSNAAQAMGIKFFVVDTQLRVPEGEETKFVGRVTLTAHFNREDLWEAILQRLNGVELYKGGDLQSELIGILQGQVDMLEAELEQKGTADKERAQRAEQSASLANAERVRAQQHAELLQAQLSLQSIELAETKGVLGQWQRWHAAHQAVCSSVPR